MWQNKHYKKYASRRIEAYKKKKKRLLDDNTIIRGVHFRKTIHPILKSVIRLIHKMSGLTYSVVGKKENVRENETVIYAITHIGKFDFEIVMDSCIDFCYPMAGDWELMYGEVDDYFLRLNGVVYVDTSDKQDRNNTFRLMVKMLKNNVPILIFPEGVWNLTESTPVMKLYPGIVKAAKESGVPIVPIAVEQYGKHFVVNVGDKIYVRDDENMELQKLRDILATLQWNNWEQTEIQKREDIVADYYEQFIEFKLSEWPQFNMNIVNERIYKDRIDRELEAIKGDLGKL